MKYKLWIFIAALFCFHTVTFSQSQKTYFIKYKNSVPLQEVDSKVNRQSILPAGINSNLNIDLRSVKYLANGLGRSDETLSRIVKITVGTSTGKADVLNLKNFDSSIEYIEEAKQYSMDIVPNDTLISEQWALEKIQAFDAWDKTEGADTVLLAIIDTGIDYLHPDLRNKVFLNQGETGTDANGNDKRFNGIDDDNNGFIDDYRGWDFTDRQGFPFDSSGGDYLDWDNDPMDENGHGTYIGGIAGAETNNITGIAGVAPKVKLLNLRAFDPSGFGEEDDVAAAILYAVQMNAKVINMSFGDDAFSLVLRDVIRFAHNKGVVLVGSSGNSGSTAPHYPSGYTEVISVGNSTVDDFVSSNSNYGSTLDLVAPGTAIFTTARDNNYAIISGTSAATPHVSGAAALILSLGNFTNEEVKQIIKSTTDDIQEPGWDMRSGAGRLNLNKALTVLAPSIIKFNHPTQDFATLDDQITINATVLSPFFTGYSLYYGVGYNPNNWVTLIENGTNQLSNEDIYTLDVSSLTDSAYTLRLVVQLSNGRTMEERVNFLISRTPPGAELISVGPAFYGDKTTILAAMYTDEPALVRMYYRKIGGGDFNFVTLDGFTINNQFIQQYHYGFIPQSLVTQNSAYEIYFEVENLVGLTTTVKNQSGQNFLFSTSYEAEYFGENEQEFSLPSGSIFENPVNITTNQSNEIFMRELTSPKVSVLYRLEGNSFTRLDSLQDRIIRDAGDFNFNGLTDVLSFFIRNGYIYEQSSPNSSTMNQKFAQETGDFWPVMAKDIDQDGTTEIIVVDSDTSFTVWKLNNDLSVSNPIKLSNFTESRFGSNIIDSPNGVIADINGDSAKEFWAVDLDGDIFSYEIFGPDDYRPGSAIQTDFFGSAAYIASGDYNGDGIDELAVLLHSIDQVDVAPFYRLIVFNLIGNKFNVIYDQALVDAASEFNSAFQKSENSLRFADIDNDSRDELIVFMFPYAYIFKNDFGVNKIVSYKENINSNSVFVGDLNLNGVPEIAFPTAESIKFYEFTGSEKTNTPYNVSGYSIDSSSVRLTWNGNVDQYFIYRGNDADNLVLIDSVISTSEYFDFNLSNNTSYFYAVQAFDPIKPVPLSSLSPPVEIFVHTPGVVLSAEAKSSKTVLVTFSEKMNNTIENMQAFELVNVGIPNSIAPANQFAYLLTFINPIPIGNNQLIVQDLKDFYGSPIVSDIIDFTMDSSTSAIEFFISSFQIDDPYSVTVKFNLDVDEATATNVNNYSFDPDNKATSVSVDDNDKKVIHINLKGHKPVGSIGKEYVLRIQNVRSSTASGNIPINSGAGSFIVLTQFAKDLSDVYVYPNPVKISSGQEKVTFANLPQRAKITIWTLDGTKVGEVEETDGNGGTDYNLRNRYGELLGSGIYIYRVVMFDEQNNEGDEKVGKFAVLR